MAGGMELTVMVSTGEQYYAEVYMNVFRAEQKPGEELQKDQPAFNADARQWTRSLSGPILSLDSLKQP